MDAGCADVAYAAVWFDCGEGVVGDFCWGEGGGAEEGGFACVWFSDDA